MQGKIFSDGNTIAPVASWQRLFCAIAILLMVSALSACIPQATDGAAAGSRDIRLPQPPQRTAQIDDMLPPNNILQANAVWEAAPVTRNAITVSQDSYVVKPGDTLRGIGNITGAGSEALALANGLEPPFIIYPGQRLIVPTGRFHTVNSGESGIAIARAYGVPWREIVELNQLDEPYILRIGQRLQLPNTVPQNFAGSSASLPSSSSSSAADDLEKRAAAFSLNIDDIVTGGQPALAENTSPSVGTAVPTKAGLDVPIDVPDGFNGQFVWPANGPLLSSFGSKGSGKVNDGIAIAAASGTPFTAAADGVVAYAGNAIPSLGNLVLIDHGSGWVTAYGHADNIIVARGQKVKAGQRLGLVGQSGLVDKPQLHFEVRQNRKPIDPVKRLPAR